jgi:hypothetical protein
MATASWGPAPPVRRALREARRARHAAGHDRVRRDRRGSNPCRTPGCTILGGGSATGGLRAGTSAGDIAAGLIGISTVAGKPGHRPQAQRLPGLLMDGLRQRPPGTDSRSRGRRDSRLS